MAMSDPRHVDPATMDLVELTKEALLTTGQLVETQVELLRAEMSELGRDAQQRAISVGVGVGFAATTATLLLTTICLAIANAAGIPAFWFVGGATLLSGIATWIGFGIGLRRAKERAFDATRRQLKEEITWVKKQT